MAFIELRANVTLNKQTKTRAEENKIPYLKINKQNMKQFQGKVIVHWPSRSQKRKSII